jgi:pilus assembly protein Flp/PilA
MDYLSGSKHPAGVTNPTQQQEIHPMLTSYEFLATYLRSRFGDDERGASLVEYALLVALIAVVCIVAVTFLGKSASGKFDSVGKSISAP